MGQGTGSPLGPTPPQTGQFTFGFSGPNAPGPGSGGPGEGGPGSATGNQHMFGPGGLYDPSPGAFGPNQNWRATPWLQTSATSALQQELGRGIGRKNSANVLEGNYLMREAMHNAIRFDPTTGRMHVGTVNQFVQDPTNRNSAGSMPSGHYQMITDPSDPRYWNVNPMSQASESALQGLEQKWQGKKKQWKS